MMKKLLFLFLLLGAVTMSAIARPSGSPERQPAGKKQTPGTNEARPRSKAMPLEQFTQLHASVAPQGDTERWTEIPWMLDLNAAREKAARERKPLLMWVMDGHPLGCT